MIEVLDAWAEDSGLVAAVIGRTFDSPRKALECAEGHAGRSVGLRYRAMDGSVGAIGSTGEERKERKRLKRARSQR